MKGGHIAAASILFLAAIVALSLAAPSSYFQFPGVNEAEIQQMTLLAKGQEQLYAAIEQLRRSEAEAIVASLSEGYDDVVVTYDLHNINHYWVIAIASVLNEQSLDAGESELRALLAKNLVYTWKTEPYQESDGESDNSGDDASGETKMRIIINIRDTAPDVLMRTLGFTQFQTKWARFLYANISDSQVIQPDSPDYPAQMIDYGDIVFREGSREVVYYNQTDERWGSRMYGKSHSIAVGGCGPTALAMAVSSLTGRQIDPGEMAAWAYDNGYCADGNGSYHSLIPGGGAAFGLTVTGGITDAQQLADALAAGKLVVAIMGPGHFTVSGHYIVLRGITAEGKVLVADPVSVRKSGQEWDLEIVWREAKWYAAAGGPFWVFDR